MMAPMLFVPPHEEGRRGSCVGQEAANWDSYYPMSQNRDMGHPDCLVACMYGLKPVPFKLTRNAGAGEPSSASALRDNLLCNAAHTNQAVPNLILTRSWPHPRVHEAPMD